MRTVYLVIVVILLGMFVSISSALPLAAQSSATSNVESPATGQIVFTSNRSGRYEIYAMNPDGSGVQQLTNDSADNGQYGLTVSPDGKHIVFSRNPRNTQGPDNSELYIADSDGSNIQQLTQSSSSYPAYSPDGKHIVFVGDYNNDSEIVLMNADGSNLINLTNSMGTDKMPSWSPDSKQIVFASNRNFNSANSANNANNYEIYVMDSNGSRQQRLTTTGGVNEFPSWSPDGQHILFSSDRDGLLQLFVMNPDGSALRPITRGNTDNYNAVWSPDGKFIAVVRTFGTAPDVSSQIFRMDADGFDLQQVTAEQGNNGYPGMAWIVPPTPVPTSTPSLVTGQIVFASNQNGQHQIYVMNADGSNSRQLTQDPYNNGQYGLTVSPDGKHIVFTSNRWNNRSPYSSELFIMDSAGSNIQQLTDFSSYYPAYSPDGKHIICARNYSDTTAILGVNDLLV